MFETEATSGESEQKPAKPLTPKQIAARQKTKKLNTVAVIICASLCAVLGVISAVLPSGVSTPWMFASYAAGYVGVMWALAGLWSHYMGPNAPK
jgi:hypothetical protein